jgi:type I restriction enzyme M protein
LSESTHPNLVKATKMNMVMNNDGSGGLYQGNSLAPRHLGGESARPHLIGQVDLLFTNPFGSKTVDDPAILEKCDLGHTWNYDSATDIWSMTEAVQKSQPPEILFIERCVKFLKPGTGRLAIVLPDGILGSPGLGYVGWFLANTRILQASTCIRTPSAQRQRADQRARLAAQDLRRNRARKRCR